MNVPGGGHWDSLPATMVAVDVPRILLVHNRYRDRAGEDLSFDADRELLLKAGIPIAEYVRDNKDIDEGAPTQNVRVAFGTTWARQARKDVLRSIESHAPDVVHFHNTFPLISPAPYWACRDAGVPVVQSLRNFRLFCAPGVFFRDGHVCEDCVGKTVTWPAVVHACYGSSRPRSSAVAMMQTVHSFLGTWSSLVDAYVVPSSFMRSKLIECGLPEALIHVRPDVVVDATHAEPPPREAWGLFVGRLTIEKGILTLLKALRLTPDIRLKVVGTGPLEEQLREQVRDQGLQERVEILGSISHAETLLLLHRARFLVAPSESYETFGRIVIEAFASRTPVITSGLGALGDAVSDGHTALLFEPKNERDLSARLTWAVQNPDEMVQIANNARALYETSFDSESCLRLLLAIYDKVRESA